VSRCYGNEPHSVVLYYNALKTSNFEPPNVSHYYYSYLENMSSRSRFLRLSDLSHDLLTNFICEITGDG
jgi:hypothetical protein